MQRETTRPSRVNERIALAALMVLYAGILHWTFQHKIAPAFWYLGFRYREHHLQWEPYLLALAMAYLVGLVMPKRLRKPSDFILWVLYVMTVIPALVLPQILDAITQWKAIEHGVVITSSFILVALLANIGPRDLIPRVHMPPGVLWWLVGMLTVLTYGYIYSTSGLSFTFVSLTDVRDIRFAYREQIQATGSLLGYLVRLQGNVLNPILVARGIYSRRWYLIVLGLIGQLLIFSVTGYKITFLSVVAIALLALVFRLNLRPRGALFVSGAAGLSLVALAIDQIRGALWWTEVFVDRLLIAPGVLPAAYVKIFDGQPKTQWSYSFLSWLTHNPYPVTPEFLVGANFMGDPQTAANANYFADGYANLGYPGIYIEAAMLLVLLWVMNSAGRHLPLVVSSLILLVPTIALANSSPFTSVLTNGFAFAAVMMAMLPGTGWGLKRRRRRMRM